MVSNSVKILERKKKSIKFKLISVNGQSNDVEGSLNTHFPCDIENTVEDRIIDPGDEEVCCVVCIVYTIAI